MTEARDKANKNKKKSNGVYKRDDKLITKVNQSKKSRRVDL